MGKHTTANQAPKSLNSNNGSKTIWQIAAANNESPKRVTRRFNPNVRRVGLL